MRQNFGTFDLRNQEGKKGLWLLLCFFGLSGFYPDFWIMTLWVRLIRHMFHLASSIWDTNSLNSHWTVILHPPAQARAVKWVPSCWVSASPAKFFFSFPSPLNEFGIFVLTFLQQSPRAPGLQTLLELDSHHWPALHSVSSHYKFFCLIPCACFSDRWLPMATGCRCGLSLDPLLTLLPQGVAALKLAQASIVVAAATHSQLTAIN